MQVKNDYTARDAALLATQFYLGEKIASQHIRIYDLNGEDVEVVGTIVVPALNIVEALAGEVASLTRNNLAVLEMVVYVEFCHVQGVTNSKIIANLEVISLQQEQFIECVLKYVETCVESILSKFKEYEDMLDVPTVIEDDSTFAVLTAMLLEDDFSSVSPDMLTNELFAMLYGAFCRECRKMHNPFRQCGSIELKQS